MLDFMVTGQVPGTRVVITFTWIVAVMTVVIGGAMIRRLHKQHELLDQVSAEELSTKS